MRRALIIAISAGALLLILAVYLIFLRAEPVTLTDAQKEFESSVQEYPKLLRYYNTSGDLFAVDWMEKDFTISLNVEPATGMITGAVAFREDHDTGVIQEALGEDPEQAVLKLEDARWDSCVKPTSPHIPRLADQIPNAELYDKLGYQAEHGSDGVITYRGQSERTDYTFKDGMLTEIAFYPPHNPLAKIELSYPDRDQPVDLSDSVCQ